MVQGLLAGLWLSVVAAALAMLGPARRGGRQWSDSGVPPFLARVPR